MATPTFPRGSYAGLAILLLLLAAPVFAQTDTDTPRTGAARPTVIAPVAARPSSPPDGPPPSGEKIDWDAGDLKEALAIAQQQGAPVLVLFVRPDVPMTTRLIEEFAAKHRAALPKNLRLARVAADQDPGAEQARGLGILDLPTAIVFAASGEEIDRAIGYTDPDSWRLAIQRAAGGHDPLPTLLAHGASDPHSCYETGWRLLVRGEVAEGMELLRRVYTRDDGNAAGHTVAALRLMARYTEQIRERPRLSLDYWSVLLEEYYDNASHAEALSAMVRIYPALEATQEGFAYLRDRARDRLDDYRRLDDVAAYAERTGHGTLEAAGLLRESLRLSAREQTGGILLRLLLSEGRIWDAERQVLAWREAGWSGPRMDSLATRVNEARRRLDDAWSTSFDTPPQVERQTPPECPQSAIAIGAEGQVTVRAFVREDGQVVDARLHSSSGVDALDGAALEAILTWQFRPAKREGEPVPAQVLIPLRFDCR